MRSVYDLIIPRRKKGITTLSAARSDYVNFRRFVNRFHAWDFSVKPSGERRWFFLSCRSTVLPKNADKFTE